MDKEADSVTKEVSWDVPGNNGIFNSAAILLLSFVSSILFNGTVIHKAAW